MSLIVVLYQPMAVEFATVAEAQRIAGKSESTIKRLVREIVADPNHTDRWGIHPNHEELQRLRAAGQPYVWKIDRELLLRRFPLKERQTPQSAAPAAGQAPGDVVIGVLQEQLRSKDEQIRTLEKQLDRKDEQIANLNERQRETNVLMRELQARLALAAPRPPAVAQEIAAGQSPAPPRDQPAAPPPIHHGRRNRLLRLLGL